VIVSRLTGKVVRTLVQHIGLPGGLRWSPDGRFITFFESPEGNLFAWWLAIVPASGGPVQPLLKDRSLSVWDVQWSPTSKHLIAEIVQETQAALVTIDIEENTFRKLADVVTSQADYGFSTNDSLTAYLNQSVSSPNDVWVFQADGSTRRLTNLNPQTASWQLGNVHKMTWKNIKDGTALHGVLITPPDYQSKSPYPTIVQAHQGDLPWWTGWQGYWWAWGQFLASNGYVVFLPNTRGVTGQGWKLHQTIGDWGGMAYQDLLDGVDWLVAQGVADPNRLGIGGWSNGGFMTEYAITQTTRFKAAVALAGASDFFSLFGTSPIRTNLLIPFHTHPYVDRKPYDAASPITWVRNCKTPTLLLHGQNDPVVPVSQGYEFYYALKALGVDTEMVIYPREYHDIWEQAHRLDLQRRVLAWFNRYLKNAD
jgi:dipeptidyl aminopeptidase/acylaminoacyl peptidase